MIPLYTEIFVNLLQIMVLLIEGKPRPHLPKLRESHLQLPWLPHTAADGGFPRAIQIYRYSKTYTWGLIGVTSIDKYLHAYKNEC